MHVVPSSSWFLAILTLASFSSVFLSAPGFGQAVSEEAGEERVAESEEPNSIKADLLSHLQTCVQAYQLLPNPCDQTRIFCDSSKEAQVVCIEAIHSFQEECSKNSGVACTNLGIMRAVGAGVVKSGKAAVSAWAVACGGGNLSACDFLGRAYFFGSGVQEDMERAAPYLRMACDGGRYQACNPLGFMLLNGWGFPPDMLRARAAWKTGCDRGGLGSCAALAMHHRQKGTQEDLAQAALLFQKICDEDLHHRRGCMDLGLMAENGEGVPKDRARAVRLYRLGCEAGEPYACRELRRIDGE